MLWVSYTHSHRFTIVEMEKTNKNKHEDLAVELLEFRTFHVAVDNGGFSGQQVMINS